MIWIIQVIQCMDMLLLKYKNQLLDNFTFWFKEGPSITSKRRIGLKLFSKWFSWNLWQYRAHKCQDQHITKVCFCALPYKIIDQTKSVWPISIVLMMHLYLFSSTTNINLLFRHGKYIFLHKQIFTIQSFTQKCII